MNWKPWLLSCALSFLVLPAHAQTPKNLYNGEAPVAARCVSADGLSFESCGGAGTATSSSTYSIKRDNIANSSVNLAFGFTSKKVALEFPLTNTDEICVSWAGGTAVCPAANTAGHARFLPGTSIILDNFSITSVSVIASSGTQTVFVRAW